MCCEEVFDLSRKPSPAEALVVSSRLRQKVCGKVRYEQSELSQTRYYNK